MPGGIILELALLGVFLLSFFIIILIIFKKRNNKIRDKIHGLANNTIELTPEEFMKMRSSPFFVKEYDFTGVYIIFNESQNMHYIGKSTNVFIRINSHFTGKGNGDIYADGKYGDSFKIKGFH